MKKILVPTDFSKEASYALEAAFEIAKQHPNAQITLLHIIESPTLAEFNVEGEYIPQNMDDVYVVKLIEKAKENLSEVISSFKRPGVDILSRISIGSPYNGIAEMIAQYGIDLIVMGSKGASGVKEALVGSNTEKVVRHANCPVLVIKAKPENFKIREIVFASDFREKLSTIKSLKELQSLFFAKLRLVFINTAANFEASDLIFQRMEKFAESHELENYDLDVYGAESEEVGISKFTESIKADVIAIATHGRKALSHLLMGSLTEDLVNHSKTMVFTFHVAESKITKGQVS